MLKFISVGEYKLKKRYIIFYLFLPFVPIGDVKDSFCFKRKQIPIRLWFAMKINKAQ